MAATGRAQSSRLRWVLGIGAVLVVIGLVGAWFATRPAAPQTDYEVFTVTRTTQNDTVSLAGTIYPQEQANAAFKVPGTITEIGVKVGDAVVKGDALAHVDTRDLSDAVALADANLSAARAQLNTVRDTSGASDAQLEAARASVRSAEASLANARNRLADATLVSPLSGTIAKVGYSVGDQVSGTGSSAVSAAASGLSGLGGIALTGSSGTSANAASSIVVISTDAWQLNASVGTADLPSIKSGQEAEITPTGTSTTVHGIVDTVGIVATQNAGATATFPVTIKVTDAGARLFSGSSADAVVTTGTHSDVLTVPIAAVTTANGVSTVEAVTDAGVVVKTVTIGRRFASAVEIVSGLAEGDRIQVPKAQVVKTTPPMFPRSASPSASATR